MAQQVEHFLGKEEVTGSNPVSSSRRKTTRNCGFFLFYGELYFQVQHFNKKKEFIQKLLYNEVSKKIKRQELMYELYTS